MLKHISFDILYLVYKIITKPNLFFREYLLSCEFMSPNHWSGSNANVFIVNSSGYLNWNNVNNTYGLRPILFYNSKY